jgi:hypothetical protein
MTGINVHFAMLCGPSCIGKSTTVELIRSNGAAWEWLDFDNEIVGKSFDTLKHPRCSIGPPFTDWEQLKGKHDVSRLFRVHHRDWFLRAGQPRQFIADGCLYLKRQHRQEAREGLNRVPGYVWQFAFIWLWPKEKQERLRRYRVESQRRHPERQSWTEEKWRDAFRHHSQVAASHFEPPDQDECILSTWAESETDVMGFLGAWLAGRGEQFAKPIPLEQIRLCD